MTSEGKSIPLNHFKNLYPDLIDDYLVIVSVTEQTLSLFKQQKLIESYLISTAIAGTGNRLGSYKTPIGLHEIAEKIGDDADFASIFKARENTDKIAKILKTPDSTSNKDLITSRILWLKGLEDGVNKGVDSKGNNIDSHARYIYIHGTDEEGRLGQTASHGCVRMANQDVIDLYERVKAGCLVFISESQ